MSDARGFDEGATMRRHWGLDEDVVFLNHGSFGACPLPVLAEQRAWRERLEAEPVRFFVREYEDALDHAKAELARFIGADAHDLAFVANATTGVNTVLRSLELRPGDELLITDHAYGACRNALEFVAARAGATVRVARLPSPVGSSDAIVDAMLSEAGTRTRLALIDQITSPSAWVLPVDALVEALQARGIDTLVDAAHAPGMVAMDLRATGAAYTTGNCHKWLCAPKGAAFLHVRADKQAQIRPLVISHGATAALAGRSRFELEHDWTGTSDPSAWLSVPSAIAFMGSLLPGGWPALRARNHALACSARDRLLARLGTEALCPREMLGSMAAVRVPALTERPDSPPAPTDVDPLQERLWRDHRIEVPVQPSPGRPGERLLRVSTQAYTTMDDIQRLIDAL
ncbi:MAG: aminotransferase class V-fold PLP-dependent enzyme [Deltaproteobacteria bacterium]|nr:aminotransferase class V-fold PLP-dependent enzyme [Deltaproteobacteria bacterium]